MTPKHFSFVARGKCKATKLKVELLCVFIEARSLAQQSLFDVLTAALKQETLLPDGVLVIADDQITARLVTAWTTRSAERDTFLARCRRGDIAFVKAVQFVGWHPDGTLEFHAVPNEPVHFKLPFTDVVSAGMAALVADNPVVQMAPAGHTFKHPSGRANKVFLQARELASDETELAFVARALVATMPALADKSLARVFIDSMAIYPIVREALSFTQRDISVQSFHSYEDLSRLVPPLERYLVAISASTTGGMADKLVEQSHFAPECLITLVDVQRKGRRGKILFALVDTGSTLASGFPGGAETQIELTGEHFSFRSKPPRDVTLGTLHEPKHLRSFLTEVGGECSLGLNFKVHQRPHIVAFDGAKVVASAAFSEWLRREIAWEFPGSIDHIVAVDDNGSLECAQACAERIRSLSGAQNTPPVVKASELTAEALAGAKGVAVVQAVAGDGAKIREVSRDLREYIATDIPRHFLVGLAAPQTTGTWERLEQFLARNPSDRKYGFSTWRRLPLGVSSVMSAWDVYRELASSLQTADVPLGAIDHGRVTRALEAAARVIEESGNGFLPSPRGEALRLTDGFVFFPDDFAGLNNPATIHMTIAAVMQCARDMKSESPQLKATSYESVVLSPENFSRFNDNILQACLLRAALPSELDYSSSPELSGLMREFVAKVFARRDHVYGAAALEFAAALLSKRMRLIESDLIRLRDQTLELLGDEPGSDALLGLIYLLGRLAPQI